MEARTLLAVTPGTPDLIADFSPGVPNDTGASNTDNITNRNNSGAATQLKFDVSGTTIGATVSVLADGVSIGNATAAGTTTTVTTNGTTVLTDGPHAITAIQTDLAGPSAPSAALTVTVDTTGATMNIQDVTPDPRNTGVDTVTILFNEPVVGFESTDLGLTRNGVTNLLTAAQTLTTVDNITWTLGNLTNLTDDEGSYVLGLAAASPGITDLAGNALAAPDTDSFVVDNTPPTVGITDVTPDPRTAPVPSITIVFSEPVTGFDLTDLALRRGGGANLLTAAQTLTSGDNVTWTLGNLAGLTDVTGTYVLTLTAAGSAIADAAGNTLAVGDSDSFAVNSTPTADIVDVTPDPRAVPVGTITIAFSEAVTGFDLIDLALRRDGGANLLGGAQTLTTADNVIWTLNNLAGLTAADGNYVLTLTAAGSGIQDASGNALAADASDAFTVDNAPTVMSVGPVSPDPRTAPVPSITIVFSEPVTGFDTADLTSGTLSLTRDGSPVSLGTATLTPVDGRTYILGNLTGLTTPDGTYVLTLTAAGSGIQDARGNALAADAGDSFTVDNAPPTADVVDVAPDPRTIPVDAITIAFNQPVTGFNLADLTLTLNGGANLLTGAQTLTTADNITWTLGSLTGLTAADGTYVLTLTAAGSGIADLAGNALAANASDTFVVDATPPTVDIVDVTPDPRNGAVDTITITFSEPITGFDPADLTLRRNGGANLLTGAQTLTTADTITWTLNNLTGLTGAAGTYVLGLTAAGSGITDAAGNALALDASDSFVVDTAAPTADVVDVAPDPRNVPVGTITITFSEPVIGFDLADLALRRDGDANLLTGAQTLATADGLTWTLADLAGLTGIDGTYVLSLTAAGSGITDAAGNALAGNASDTFVVDTTPPTADVVDVTPDPRNGAVGTITIVFSEPVTGFNLPDLTLRRNGGANLLTGAQTLTTADTITWTLNNLTGLTGAAGTYVLGLTAAGSNIVDAAGNALALDAGDSFVVDTAAPTADVVDVTPDPRNVPVGTITIAFNEPVIGFDLADLALTRDGGANLLTGAQTLTSADGRTWTLGDLAGLTAAGGTYLLSLTAAGSNVVDAAGNALAAGAGDAFTVDTTPPTVDIVDVTPDPRNGAIGTITILFSEPVTGFDLDDLALSRNGSEDLLTGAQAPVPITADGRTWILGNLAGLTGVNGTYVLSLTAAGSGIADLAGNALAAGASDAFAVDLTPPTADIVDVAPDPRNVPVGTITIAFSEPVIGFDLADLALRRNGGPNLLTGAQGLTSADGRTWTLGDLAGLTAAVGNYVLSLTAAGSGIADAAGNALTAGASDAFAVDLTPPTADIVDVAPDPRNNAVGTITIAFNEPVIGFNLADLALTRDGGANLLTAAQTLTSGDNVTWTLGNLAGLTAADGNYVLTLTAAGSGIQDAGGNALAANASDAFTVTSQVIIPPPGDGTGPVVLGVRTVLARRRISAIVVTFNEPLDPARAQNLANYALLASGADRRFGNRNDRAVALRLATVSADGLTVALIPVRPLARNQAYRLTVNGTSVGVGVADRAGNLLDGEPNGTPGGNFLGRFGAAERPARVSARAFDLLASERDLPVGLRNRRRS